MFQSRCRFLAISLVPLALLALPSAGAHLRLEPPAWSISLQQTQEQWNAEFRKFRDVGDMSSIAKAIQQQEFYAQTFAISQLELVTTSGSAEVNTNIKLLRAAWEDIYRSDDFLTNAERYLGSLTPGTRAQRSAQIQSFNAINTRLLAKLAEGSGAERAKAVLGVAAEMEPLGPVFEDLGDQWMAARAYYSIGFANDTFNIGEEYGRLAEVFRCYTKFIALRTSLGLEDRMFKDVKLRLEELAKLGFDPSLAPEAAGAVVVGIKLGTPRRVEVTAFMLEEPDAVVRPNFSSDVSYPTWPSVYLTKDGSQDTFDAMERSPTITRAGAAEVQITGSDGKVQKVALTGKVTRVDTTTGTTPRPWSCFFQTGNQNDYYHDIQANLSPSAESLNLYYLPASAMQFTVDEVVVQVFDDNGDGSYGSKPLTRGYADITKGEYQVDIDCMLIGKAKAAVPFSEYTQIGSAWYRLLPQDSGVAFEVTPAEVVSGSVELDFKGAIKPDWIVIQGQETLVDCFFDLTSGKKVEVPVGRYNFLCGGFREGDRPDGIKKGILTAGKNMPPLLVKAGEVTKLTLGAPFAFEFKSTVSGNKCTVLGNSITVVGAGGERYHRLWNSRVQPEVLIRKAGGKKGSKGGRMSLIGDAQTLSDKGFEKAWKPLDMEVENTFGNEVELQLVQEKSKQFGKIESEWTKAE
jgi:hypothetical protein